MRVELFLCWLAKGEHLLTTIYDLFLHDVDLLWAAYKALQPDPIKGSCFNLSSFHKKIHIHTIFIVHCILKTLYEKPKNVGQEGRDVK